MIQIIALLLGIFLSAHGQFGPADALQGDNFDPFQSLCIDHVLSSGGPDPLNCTTVLDLLAASPTPTDGCETLFSPTGPNQHMCDLSCGFCGSKPKLIPPELHVLSPVHSGYYVQDFEHVKLECEIVGRDPSGISLAHTAQFCVTVTHESHGSNISDGNNHSSFDYSAEPLNTEKGSHVVHHECGNALQSEWRALAVRGQPSGKYVAHFELSDSVYGFVVSAVAPFFLHRAALKEAVFGDSNTSKQGQNNGSQQPHKPVLALAIKYGTQGDSATVSVAVDGHVLMVVPLADLFLTHKRSVRRALAREQHMITIHDAENTTFLFSRPPLTGAHVLSTKDAQELSGHLALQAATGFANGCSGLYVTSAGVTRTCADPYRARQRWVAAANRIHAAVRALVPLHDDHHDVIYSNNDDDKDESGDAPRKGHNKGNDDSYIRNNRHDHVEPAVRFEVAVFVSATEDARHDPTAPLEHAKYAFRGVQRWALEDDCEAVGDPSLLLWARASGASEHWNTYPGAQPGSNDDSSSSSGSSSSDISGSGSISSDSSSSGSTSNNATIAEASPLPDLNAGVQPFPSALGVTAHTTSTLKMLLRRVKRGGKPFTVCRPGYGWDTTLAHRRLVSPEESLGAFEALLLEQHAGVPIDSDDCDNDFETSRQGPQNSDDGGIHYEAETIDDNVHIGSQKMSQASKKSSLEAYLDAWNSAVLGSCDVVAVYPATAGRVADYCAHGVKTRQFTPATSMPHAATNDGIGSSSNEESVSSSHNKGSSAIQSGGNFKEPTLTRPCDTVDARYLGGVAQLVNLDTWFYELRGLRVLVVSPFARTIEKQYVKHRQSLFDQTNSSSNSSSESSNGRSSKNSNGNLFPGNPNALPEFKSLVTLEPPIGKSRGQWSMGLAWTQAQLYAMADDFDVALVSAGGWGPLVQEFIAETLNKSSIYMGGALQLHFGIWGGRFFNTSSLANALATSEWTWPEKAEADAVESGLILAGHEYAGGYGAESMKT